MLTRPWGRTLGSAAAIGLLGVAGLRGQTIRYVDAAATGANTGTSWVDAFPSPTDALLVAQPADQLWVAAGVYRPGAGRDSSFFIPAGVSLYGGFLSGMDALSNRNARVHLSILSGDLNQDDNAELGNRTDNTYHVVRVEGVGDVTLDGFVIRGGFANVQDALNPDSYGGGLQLNNAPNVRIANCIITDNAASGGGGMHLRKSGNLIVENCIFSGNQATYVSANDFGCGALAPAAFANYPALIRHCVFTGNRTAERGGVCYSSHVQWDGVFLNCLIVGNQADSGGGGLYLRNFPKQFANCTFSGNMPEALFIQATTASGTNSIFWNNSLDYSTTGGGALTLTYSDILSGGFAPANSNLAVDPVFEMNTSGTWTAGAVYDRVTGRTALTDANAAWPAGSLTHAVVNPNLVQLLQFAVATNTAHTVWVWGDATTGLVGAQYRIQDFRLKRGSPCIDTGNPAFDWAQEPDYPDGRIDMGAYGNTALATSTNIPATPSPTGLNLLIW